MRGSLSDPLPQAARGRALLALIAQYGIGAAIPAVVSLLSAAIFTRALTAAAYGRATLAVNSQALLAGLGTLWLQQAVLRYIPGENNPESARTLKRVVVSATITICASTVAGGLFVIGVILGSVEATWQGLLLPTLLAAAVTGFSNVTFAILQAEFRAGWHAAIRVVGALLRFGAGLLLVLVMRVGEKGIVWALFLASLLMIPLQWRLSGCTQTLRFSPSGTRGATRLQDLARYGVPIAGWLLAAELLYGADRYIIQLTRGSAEVGMYAASYDVVAGAVQALSGPVLLAVHPYLIRTLGQLSRRQLGLQLSTLLRWYSLFGSLLCGFVLLFGESAVRMLVGSEFASGAAIVPLVFFGNVVWILGYCLHKPIELAQRSEVLFGLGIGAAFLNITLNCVFIPLYGYVAGAVTTVIAYSAYVAGVISYLRWKLEIRLSLGPSIRVCITNLAGCLGVKVVSERAAQAVGRVGASAVAGALFLMMVLIASAVAMRWVAERRAV